MSLRSDRNIYTFLNSHSAVGIVIMLHGGPSGFRIPQGQEFYSCPKRPDQLWGPPNQLLDGHRELFPQE